MIPAWLRDHLKALGLDDSDGTSRRARVTHCRSCGAHVMRGLDADTAGMAATVDIHPLDETGEILAILAGRTTFRVSWRTDHYEVDARDRWQISGTPAGTITVVARHKCNSAPLPIAKTTRPPRRFITMRESEEAPF